MNVGSKPFDPVVASSDAIDQVQAKSRPTSQFDHVDPLSASSSHTPFFLFATLLTATALAKLYMLLTDSFADVRVGLAIENLAIVEFDYIHPYKKTSTSARSFNWLQSGKMWLDIDNHWVIVKFRGKLLEPSDNSIVWRDIVWDFVSNNPTETGLILPSKVTNYILDQSLSQTSDCFSYEFKWHPVTSRPAAKIFRLSHYGFNEPPISGFQHNSWWPVLGGLSIGLILLFLGKYLTKSVRNVGS